MELKVYVDNLPRLISGINRRTTCQEVIYALAHATGKTGRFVLVEKWRTSERSLAPHDKPLELLLKWGEYAQDVQFVLRCLGEHRAPSRASDETNDVPGAGGSAF
uniref:Ras-associating domain-containing protein n=1 Tax=Romanomermis culicivorax TaxID=13658 RepID=A0A915IEY5_ROMCU